MLASPTYPRVAASQGLTGTIALMPVAAGINASAGNGPSPCGPRLLPGDWNVRICVPTTAAARTFCCQGGNGYIEWSRGVAKMCITLSIHLSFMVCLLAAPCEAAIELPDRCNAIYPFAGGYLVSSHGSVTHWFEQIRSSRFGCRPIALGTLLPSTRSPRPREALWCTTPRGGRRGRGGQRDGEPVSRRREQSFSRFGGSRRPWAVTTWDVVYSWLPGRCR